MAGRYFGRFVGTADGPKFKNTDRPGERDSIRWFFQLWNQDGTAVVDPKKPGELATGEGLSGDSLGIGRGTPAKGRLWLGKLREAKGLPWIEPTNANAVELVTEAEGAIVAVKFDGPAGKVKLTELEVLPQGYTPTLQGPAAPVQQYAAPAQAPAYVVAPSNGEPVYTYPAPPTVAPVAAPVQAMPTPAPFIPSMPAATADAIPEMPFPPAPTA